MLKYALRENPITPAPDGFTAQVTGAHSYTQEEIIALMLRKGTTLTRADISAALELYGEVCANLMAGGGFLNTPLFNARSAISGVFKGPSDSFDVKRHEVNIHCSAGTLLCKAASAIRCEKTQAQNTAPNIAEVNDIASGALNGRLTPGGIIRLTGSRLKFEPADPAQGLFFTPETGTSVRASIIVENTPSRILALIPADLPAGTYYIEVRTKLTNTARPSKTIKAARFSKPLTVH